MICINARFLSSHIFFFMKKYVPPIFLALLSGAGLVIAGRQPSLPAAKPDGDTVQNAVSDSEDAKLDLGRPAALRLSLSPRYTDQSGVLFSANQSLQADSRPLSQIKLFESGGFTAEWRYGGQIQYRISGVNPLGANVGGRLSTNSARITLSWPTSN